MAKKIIRRTREGAFNRWLQLLEGKKLRKTTGALRREAPGFGFVVPSFCALGVLCEAARRDGGPEWKDGERYMGNTGTLARPIREFLGLTGTDIVSIVGWNDDEKLGFQRIAKKIRTEIMPRALARP